MALVGAVDVKVTVWGVRAVEVTVIDCCTWVAGA